jgi:hypothetical protein
LSRLATSFVLGYHGCERGVALQAIGGEVDLLQSNRNYDWLGPGAYFWESDPVLALEWAQWKAERGEIKAPAVVGAAIDLRNCLDLTSREDVNLLKSAYQSFIKVQKKAGLPIPQNKSAPGHSNEDRILRFLDCAVLRHLHSIIAGQPPDGRLIEPFDTVHGMFKEGPPVYRGSKIFGKSHVQIAVRNNDCILGVFLPRTPH